MPPGIDPHSYEPTPQDLRAVAEAHVVFANGFGLELFLPDLMESSGSSAPVVAVSEGIEPLRVAEAGNGTARGDVGEIDPHTWLDPMNVALWVENIAAALSALDPQNAAAYREHAGAYRVELEGLDAELRREIEEIPGADRLLVTDHDELAYFAARYGFQVVGALLPGTSTAAEPSAQEIAALEDSIRGYGVRAVFVSQVVSPGLAQRVAEDTGTALVNLHVHSLTGPEGDAPDYLSLMRYNVRAIVSALGR
jgi:ABC-type Zn uptake system ZnuABC Zn-binding protein ZnuA